jgi:hypothetical protein
VRPASLALILTGVALLAGACADDEPPDWLVEQTATTTTTTTTAASATSTTVAGTGVDSTTTTVAPTPVTSLAVGDCVVGEAFGGAQPQATEAQRVECSTPHDAEVVGLLTYEDGPDAAYPGQEQVAALAEDQCAALFEDYVGEAFGQSSLQLLTLWPTEDSWAGGDREAVCLAFDEAGPLTASVAG